LTAAPAAIPASRSASSSGSVSHAAQNLSAPVNPVICFLRFKAGSRVEQGPLLDTQLKFNPKEDLS
jgi:hypothetical protein